MTDVRRPTGRITVLVTSPRVAPGLLTRAAWQTLAGATEIGAGALGAGGSGAGGRVLRGDVQAVVGSGLAVTQVEGDVGEHWSWLSSAAEAGRDVAWLVGADGEPELLHVVAEQVAREPRPPYDVEILHGSYDVPGARLIDLVQVMDRLRRNCPWDQEQTHESLAKYLLEETYETLEAIDTGDRDHLREELGDLLLQVAFHSRVAEDAGDEGFTIDDVAGGIVEKLIRRHPHVFGNVDAADAAAVEANWEAIKATEKQRSSVLEGIPLALPALALADKILGRAAKLLPAGLPAAEPSNDTERIGQRALELVLEGRNAGIDAEQALRGAVLQLAAELRAVENDQTRSQRGL
ncbi:XTP/dITP diphosphohydrolase [Kribbella aluminosa]|uniref:XTP/dITP diphosphohydrolase n=1 Tax=Kribbella aluminosa TaxID=416017 RepID=A0ABS4UEU8_9ACTN|nr:MazG family protein [Kribbella aluminosa]MBP2350152.1 XTP/dITP diphosphohydrolase [Kribbella aluminosa]